MQARKRHRSLLPGAAALIAVGFASIACLPKPDEPVEFLTEPNAVLVQMLTAGEGAGELGERLLVPSFTLYGDGALIFARPNADGDLRLMRGRLPREAIADLLESILDERFLDFSYQLGETQGDGSGLTFLYVHTKSEANAVRASASAGGELTGEQRDHLRRMARIRSRLEQLDPRPLGGSLEGDFAPEAIELVIQPDVGTAGSPRAWLIDEIDLPTLAPPGADAVERRISGELARRLVEQLPLGGAAIFTDGNRVFGVGYRPVLPYEKSLPEFDEP